MKKNKNYWPACLKQCGRQTPHATGVCEECRKLHGMRNKHLHANKGRAKE